MRSVVFVLISWNHHNVLWHMTSCAISKCDTCVNLPDGLLHIKWYLIAPFLWREKMLLHDLFFLNLQQSAKIFEFESCDNLSWDCWQPYRYIICTCCRFYVNPVACETFCSKIQILAQPSVLMARDSFPYAICIVILIFFEFLCLVIFGMLVVGSWGPIRFFIGKMEMPIKWILFKLRLNSWIEDEGSPSE